MQHNNPFFFVFPPASSPAPQVMLQNSGIFNPAPATPVITQNPGFFISPPATPVITQNPGFFISPPATPVIPQNSGFFVSRTITPVFSQNLAFITPPATPVVVGNSGYASVPLNYSGMISQPALVGSQPHYQGLQSGGFQIVTNHSVETEISTPAESDNEKSVEVQQLSRGAICNGYHFETKNSQKTR